MARKPNILHNDIKEQIADHWYEREDYDVWPLWIDDIVSGIARLDWYGDRDNLDQISTETVMELLSVKKSQAKLYVKACTLCYRYLHRSLEDKRITDMKYPRQSIVCEEQGGLAGYHRTNKALI